MLSSIPKLLKDFAGNQRSFLSLFVFFSCVFFTSRSSRVHVVFPSCSNSVFSFTQNLALGLEPPLVTLRTPLSPGLLPADMPGDGPRFTTHWFEIGWADWGPLQCGQKLRETKLRGKILRKKICEFFIFFGGGNYGKIRIFRENGGNFLHLK